MGERPDWAPEKIFILDTEELELIEAGFSYQDTERRALYETFTGHPWIVLHRFQGELERHVTVNESEREVGKWFPTRQALLEAAMHYAEGHRQALLEFYYKAERELEDLG